MEAIGRTWRLFCGRVAEEAASLRKGFGAIVLRGTRWEARTNGLSGAILERIPAISAAVCLEYRLDEEDKVGLAIRM